MGKRDCDHGPLSVGSEFLCWNAENLTVKNAAKLERKGTSATQEESVGDVRRTASLLSSAEWN